MRIPWTGVFREREQVDLIQLQNVTSSLLQTHINKYEGEKEDQVRLKHDQLSEGEEKVVS